MAKKEACVNDGTIRGADGKLYKPCSFLTSEDNLEKLRFERSYIEKSDRLCPHCEHRLKSV